MTNWGQTTGSHNKSRGARYTSPVGIGVKRRACWLLIVSFLVSAGLVLAGAQPVQGQIIQTLAGNVSAIEGPPARQIPLVLPRAVVADPTGTYLYIADNGSRTVRKVNLLTTETTIVAGGGTVVDDLIPVPGRSASLNLPSSLALDSIGNLYIADHTQFRIRRLSTDGKITTVAGNGSPGYSGDGGPATRAQLSTLAGVAVSSNGDLLIVDRGNQAIRKVDGTGTITTIAGGPNASATGNGIPAITARLAAPYGITVDAAANVFFTDAGEHIVRRIDALSGLIETVAGVSDAPGTSGDGGPATAALLSDPRGVAVAPNGDLYIGMLGRIRRVRADTRVISTILGGGGAILEEGEFGTLVAIPSNVEQLALVAGSNTLYAALSGDNLIASVNLNSGIFNVHAGTSTLLGNGEPAINAALAQPEKLALGPDGTLYIADTFHHMIRRVAPGGGVVGTGMISAAAGTGVLKTADPSGQLAVGAGIAFPRAVFVDAANTVYFSHYLRMIIRITGSGTLEKVAGTSSAGYNGDNILATQAQLNDPRDIVKDAAGYLYIADAGNHRVRRISVGGTITTVAGTGVVGSVGDNGPGTSAQLNTPVGLLLDSQGRLLIADSNPAAGNGRVRQLDLSSGIITTIYEGFEVRGLTLDGNGNLLMAAVNRLLRLDRSTQTATIIAGNGIAGFTGDGGLASLARVGALRGIVVDTLGNIIFSDVTFCRIRRVSSDQLTPDLTVKPTMLSFSASEDGPSPPAQRLQVSTSNLVPAAWSATVQTQDGEGWLSISTNAGVTPTGMQVAVSSSSLTAGTYNGTVTISAPGATSSPAAVSVRLVVTSGEPPELQVQPQFLSFRAKVGGNDPPTQSLELTNGGGGVLTWSAGVLTSNGGEWLAVSPENGTGDAAVHLAAAVGSLSSGLYQALVQITNLTDATVQAVSVALQVEEPIPALLLTQTSVVFTSKEASSFIPEETLRVVNAGDGNLQWQATAFPLSGDTWLAISPDQGVTPAGTGTPLTLSASLAGDSGGLSQGIYDTLILFTAEGAINSTQFVLARLLVEDKDSPPKGILRPAGLRLVGSAGGGMVQSDPSIFLYSTGSTDLLDLSFIASPSTENGIPWLQVSPVAGSLVGSADKATLDVKADPASLSPGIYRGQIAVSYNSGITEEVDISFIVLPAGTIPSTSPSVTPQRRNEALLAGCTPQTMDLIGTAIPSGVSLNTGFPKPLIADVVDNCGEAVDTATVVASIEGLSIVLPSVGDGRYSGTWTPEKDSAAVMLSLVARHPTLGSVERNYSVSTSAAAGGVVLPVLSPNGVVEGAGFTPQGPLVPGSIISIFGSNFASGESSGSQIPLVRSLGGTSVQIGGEDAPLYYVGPGQINAQVPFTAKVGESVSIVVRANGRLTAPQSYLIAPAQPGIFTGAVVDVQTNTVVTASHPAQVGDDLVIYSNGLGLVDQEVATGEASQAAQTLLPVKVTVGGVEVPVAYAGLTPGLVGLYQVNVNLASGVPTGDDIEVVLEQNGIKSNSILPIKISIQ